MTFYRLCSRVHMTASILPISISGQILLLRNLTSVCSNEQRGQPVHVPSQRACESVHRMLVSYSNRIPKRIRYSPFGTLGGQDCSDLITPSILNTFNFNVLHSMHSNSLFKMGNLLTERSARKNHLRQRSELQVD